MDGTRAGSPAVPAGRGVALAAAAAALALAVHLRALPSPDVSWLLDATARSLGGERLYVDLLETNPPLIIALNLPAVLAARALHVAAAPLYALEVALLAALALVLCVRLVGGLTPAAAHRWIAPGLAFIFFLLPGRDYGQREHLALVLVAPYLALALRRTYAAPAGPGTAVLVGVLAGLGFGLKPYFLLPWLATEGALGVLRRRAPWQGRPELPALVAVGLAYLAATVIATPQYFAMVRRLGAAYAAGLREPFWFTLFTGEGAQFSLLAALAFVALREAGGRSRATWLLLAAMLGFHLAAAVQGKGWRYHFLPAAGLAAALLLMLVATTWRRAVRPVERLFWGVSVAALCTLIAAVVPARVRQALDPRNGRYDHDPDRATLAELVRRAAPDGRVLVLSSNIASAYPLVPSSGARSASRFPMLWPLASAYVEALRSPRPLAYRPPAERGPVERWLAGALAEDFARWPPDLIVALRPGPDMPAMGVRRLDYLEYLRRDPVLGHRLEGYRRIADVGEYRVLERVGLPVPSLAGLPSRPPTGGRPAQPEWTSGQAFRQLGPAEAALAAVFAATLVAGLGMRRRLMGE